MKNGDSYHKGANMKWVLALIALLSLSGCFLSDRPLLEGEPAVPLLPEGDVSAHVLLPGQPNPDKIFQVSLLGDNSYRVEAAGERTTNWRFVIIEKGIYVLSIGSTEGDTGYYLAKPADDHTIRIQLIRVTAKVGDAAVASGAECLNFPRNPSSPDLPVMCKFSTKASLLAVLAIAATGPAATVDMLDLKQKK